MMTTATPGGAAAVSGQLPPEVPGQDTVDEAVSQRAVGQVEQAYNSDGPGEGARVGDQVVQGHAG